VGSLNSHSDGVQPDEPPAGPLFSVVIPVYNGARFLEAALDSVSRQTLDTWACVIVDDGSDDGSYETALRWATGQHNPVRVLTHPGHARKGVAASRNLGISASTEAWIAFLDQDDVWLASKLERQAAFIAHHPNLTAVGCVPEILLDGIERWPQAETWARMISSIDARRATDLRLRDFVAICPYCLSGVVVRRKALVDAGGFDPRLPRTSDWLMWARLASQGPLGLVREALVVYRVHGLNEIISLADEPLGAVRGMLEMHEYLADHLARDRGKSREAAARLIQHLFLETAAAWHGAAAEGRSGQTPDGSENHEQ
jgi:glycosyltransferase involved in cell wall biosynthesis